MDTPGRKLILDLLAKSVAKINAAAGSDANDGMKPKKLKRKNISDEINPRKIVNRELVEPRDANNSKTNRFNSLVKTEYNEFENKNMIAVKIEAADKGKNELKESSAADIKIENTSKNSPGKKLILDLLKKSAEKVSANEDDRKRLKIKTEKEIQIKKEYIEERVLDIKPATKGNTEGINNIKTDKCFDAKPVIASVNSTKQGKHNVENKGEINPLKVRKARSSGKYLKKFTPEEDKILLHEMSTFGDKINFSKLGHELNRTNKTIRVRVEKLKTGNSRRSVRACRLTVAR